MKDSPYALKWVETAAELAEARSLRRAAFEEELGHDYGAMLDDLDERSLVLLCSHAGRTIGTVRLSIRESGPLEDEAQLRLDGWRDAGCFADHEIAQCTRLAIVPEFRARGVSTLLMTHLYLEVVKRGVSLVFIDASVELLSYYTRLGFRRFCPTYRHPILDRDYIPLVLFTGDAQHFQSIGSRLRRLAERDDACRARAALERVSAPPERGGAASGPAQRAQMVPARW